MLYIGMELNGFQIAAASRQYRAGKGEGTVILGMREYSHDGEHALTEWVVAWVNSEQTTSPEPATWWDGGVYLREENGSTAIDAAKRFMDKSGLQAIAEYPS
jgi:hypothetical protein